MFGRILFAAFCLLSSIGYQSSWAQVKGGKWGIGIYAGIATFSMKDLKAYQLEKMEELPFEARITESFPTYANYSVNASFIDSTRFFDMFVGRTSTGSRISYGDYSGSYTSDLNCHMDYVGGSAGFRAVKIGSVSIFTSVQMLVYFNQLKETTEEIVNNSITTSELRNFSSVNFGVGPSVDAHKRIKRVLFRLQGAYEFHIAGRLADQDEVGQYLTDSKGNELKMNAQGARLKFGLAYFF